jgi:hypothetical protein
LHSSHLASSPLLYCTDDVVEALYEEGAIAKDMAANGELALCCLPPLWPMSNGFTRGIPLAPALLSL